MQVTRNLSAQGLLLPLHDIIPLNNSNTNIRDDLQLIWKFGMPAFLNYQFHLIARIDNTTQVTIDNIYVHNEISNCLKTKLSWSKNVQEERDVPWQMMMGSMHSDYCV
jgi:hypothetical protein